MTNQPKPEVKGIEQFRQVKHHWQGCTLHKDGWIIANCSCGWQYQSQQHRDAELIQFWGNHIKASLFAFTEEQQKREVEIVSHHNTLVRLQAEQRQRAEVAEAKVEEQQKEIVRLRREKAEAGAIMSRVTSASGKQLALKQRAEAAESKLKAMEDKIK